VNLPFNIDPSAVGEFLRVTFNEFGYPLAFFGAMLENTLLLGLVLPGGSVLLGAAAYARLGDLQWPIVLVLGWLGMTTGNSIDYWLGRKALRPLLERFGGSKSFSEHFDRARRFLDRHGVWAIASGHFLGHLRSFIALAAGSSRFPFPRYLAFELAAAFLWNVIYCSLGYLLASHLDTVRLVFARIGVVGVLGIALAIAAVAVWRRLRKTAEPESGEV